MPQSNRLEETGKLQLVKNLLNYQQISFSKFTYNCYMPKVSDTQVASGLDGIADVRLSTETKRVLHDPSPQRNKS